METIIKARREKFAALLASHDIQHALVLNPGREKFNAWLIGREANAEGPAEWGLTPTLPPFNRNNAYIAPAEGEVIRVSVLTPHPTDAAQYPVLEPAQYPEIFGAEKIGIVNPECLKKVLRDKISAYNPNLEYVDITAELNALKAEKSDEEVDLARKAAKLMDRAFGTLYLILRDGMSEHQASVELRWRLSQLGAAEQDLQNMSVVRLTSAPDGGEAAEEPMLYPGRSLHVGDRINITCTSYLPIGACGALGRCYIMGKASQEAKDYWNLALKAQDVAAAAAKPGATLGEIEKKVNEEVLLPAGVQADHSAWIYGIGCDRYEAPRNVDATRDMPLTAGMTLVIAPSVKPEGKDAYQCMDVFTVTEAGAVRLSGTSRELVELF